MLRCKRHGEKGAYRFRQVRVNIPVVECKRQACSKAPAPIKSVHTPKGSSGNVSDPRILEILPQALPAMQTHFERVPGRDPNRPPCQEFLAAVKVVDTLIIRLV